jgi:hypothetical protein
MVFTCWRRGEERRGEEKEKDEDKDIASSVILTMNQALREWKRLLFRLTFDKLRSVSVTFFIAFHAVSVCGTHADLSRSEVPLKRKTAPDFIAE